VLAIRVVEDEGEEARKHSQNSPHVVASLFLLVNLYQSEHLPYLQCQVVLGLSLSLRFPAKKVDMAKMISEAFPYRSFWVGRKNPRFHG